ncbi:MAG TPA: MBOAT family O-acyltransferase [Xanthobacteraceae bacterium]|nr:MBOAT family O-acyltransferase [Xanthobacteraceae bacterium]
MLFQSQIYILVFLPAVAALYYFVAGSAVARQWALIVASLIFYGWWDVRFVLLPVSQIVATWLLALVHERNGRRSPLVAGVALNLLSLGTFKYLDFVMGSIEAASGITLSRAHIILPIGISFFSFQLISYLVDRMRGQAPIYPFRPFALFVLLYPHLIAGPIVRHNELVPQFSLDPRREGLWQRIGIGLAIFTVGLAKKVLLADKLGAIVDPVFADAGARALNLGDAWTAVLAFAFQLFLDFSAYTEMAIGSALIFGLVLPENFRRPYLATDIRDFWRRWHITLSNFLRDYLYIPLGGSRRGPGRYVLATMVTMGLCGLWHGAGWTFVVWGLWHGLGLATCHAWQRLGRPMPKVAGWALTMLFVLAGWVVFRAASFGTAGSILMSLAGAGDRGGTLHEVKLLVAAALASALIPSAHEIKDGLTNPHPALAVAGAALALYCLLEVGQGAPVNFIYFQF